MVVKKLTAGAYGVRKIIKFRKPKGRGPAQVETRWETVAAPPCGTEFRRIMEATAGADWPQDTRVTLAERVAEIRKLGEEQGDSRVPPHKLTLQLHQQIFALHRLADLRADLGHDAVGQRPSSDQKKHGRERHTNANPPARGLSTRTSKSCSGRAAAPARPPTTATARRDRSAWAFLPTRGQSPGTDCKAAPDL